MKQKAFTLIELLVVIVIIGILATISTATFGDYAKKARLAKAQLFSAQLEHTIGSSLKGSWNFDEGSGTVAEGRDADVGSGTVNNAVWSSDTPFEKGTSLDFDGSSSYVFVSNADNYLNDKMTVSAWIKPQVQIQTGCSSFGCGIANGYFLSSLRFSPGGGGSNHDGVRCRVHEQQVHCEVYSASFNPVVAVGDVPEFDEWLHVGLMIDEEALSLYLNGEKVDSVTQSGRYFLNNDNTFSIGRYDLQGNVYYKGLIDDVRIYHDVIDFN